MQFSPRRVIALDYAVQPEGYVHLHVSRNSDVASEYPRSRLPHPFPQYYSIKDTPQVITICVDPRDPVVRRDLTACGVNVALCHDDFLSLDVPLTRTVIGLDGSVVKYLPKTSTAPLIETACLLHKLARKERKPDRGVMKELAALYRRHINENPHLICAFPAPGGISAHFATQTFFKEAYNLLLDRDGFVGPWTVDRNFGSWASELAELEKIPQLLSQLLGEPAKGLPFVLLDYRVRDKMDENAGERIGIAAVCRNTPRTARTPYSARYAAKSEPDHHIPSFRARDLKYECATDPGCPTYLPHQMLDADDTESSLSCDSVPDLVPMPQGDGTAIREFIPVDAMPPPQFPPSQLTAANLSRMQQETAIPQLDFDQLTQVSYCSTASGAPRELTLMIHTPASPVVFHLCLHRTPTTHDVFMHDATVKDGDRNTLFLSIDKKTLKPLTIPALDLQAFPHKTTLILHTLQLIDDSQYTLGILRALLGTVAWGNELGTAKLGTTARLVLFALADVLEGIVQGYTPAPPSLFEFPPGAKMFTPAGSFFGRVDWNRSNVSHKFTTRPLHPLIRYYDELPTLMSGSEEEYERVLKEHPLVERMIVPTVHPDLTLIAYKMRSVLDGERTMTAEQLRKLAAAVKCPCYLNGTYVSGNPACTPKLCLNDCFKADFKAGLAETYAMTMNTDQFGNRELRMATRTRDDEEETYVDPATRSFRHKQRVERDRRPAEYIPLSKENLSRLPTHTPIRVRFGMKVAHVTQLGYVSTMKVTRLLGGNLLVFVKAGDRIIRRIGGLPPIHNNPSIGCMSENEVQSVYVTQKVNGAALSVAAFTHGGKTYAILSTKKYPTVLRLTSTGLAMSDLVLTANDTRDTVWGHTSARLIFAMAEKLNNGHCAQILMQLAQTKYVLQTEVVLPGVDDSIPCPNIDSGVALLLIGNYQGPFEAMLTARQQYASSLMFDEPVTVCYRFPGNPPMKEALARAESDYKLKHRGFWELTEGMVHVVQFASGLVQFVKSEKTPYYCAMRSICTLAEAHRAEDNPVAFFNAFMRKMAGNVLSHYGEFTPAQVQSVLWDRHRLDVNELLSIAATLSMRLNRQHFVPTSVDRLRMHFLAAVELARQAYRA